MELTEKLIYINKLYKDLEKIGLMGISSNQIHLRNKTFNTISKNQNVTNSIAGEYLQKSFEIKDVEFITLFSLSNFINIDIL